MKKQTRRFSASALLCAAALAAAARAQQGAVPFDAAMVVADKTQRFEAVLDLDGDGFADALSWYWTDDTFFTGVKVAGWLNDGQGALAEAWSFTMPVTSANPFNLDCTATGDLDGDAREDFAVAFGAEVHVWSSNGAALPTALTVLTAATAIDSLVLGDFDADGLDDVAVADNEKVRLWRNGGLGPWPPTDDFGTFGLLDDQLVAADFDGDGDDDLADQFGLEIDVFELQDGALVRVSAIVHGLTFLAGNRLAAGDVDADGDPDLVLFDNANGNCSVMRNVGGAFAVGATQPGGPATHLADVNGDGAADGVCCGGGASPPKSTHASQFEIALNDGSGDFAAAFSITSLGSSHIAGVADLDHDGDTDLVGGRTIYWAPAPLSAAPHAGFDSGDGLDVWGASGSIILDADNDGDPDARFGALGWQANNGAGKLLPVPAQIPPVPELKKWLGPGFPGDFDGDGDVDVVVSRWSGLFSHPTFHDNWLLRNSGAGLLWTATPATAVPVNMSGTAVPIDMWDEPAASLATDADADGDLDLLVRAGLTTGPTTLWLNDGNGLFAAGATWPEGVQGTGLLNGDALPDLVFTTSGAVRVRFGTGGGAFGAALSLATAVGPKDGVALVDADGDDDLDLIAASDVELTPHLWLNDGAGTFTLDATALEAFPMFFSGSLPDHFVVLDVNGDGLLDVVGGASSTAVTGSWVMLRRRDAPGFESGGLVCVRLVSAADMDGDGDGDLLGQDAEFEDIIVPGLLHHGPTAGKRLQYGASTAGSGGAKPVLGASGPFRVGESASLKLAGLPSGKLGLLTVGLAQSDLPGTPWVGSTAYNWPWLTYFFVVSPPGEPGAPGSSELSLGFVVIPELPGVGPVFHQAWFADPGAPGGRVGTNGLLLEYE